ncbi:MAG: hypothetical protein NXI32_08235 [bacterium]|nr:hypothetical protein [bacterium]
MAEFFLNPFWDSNAALPGNVVVFNDGQQFVGYLASSSQSVLADVEKKGMYPGDTAGTMLTVKTGAETIVTTVQRIKLVNTLGPGKYFFQGFYTDRFLRSDGDGTVVAASELASLEILPAGEFNSEMGVTPDRSGLGRAEIIVNNKEDRIHEKRRFEIRYTNTTGRAISVYNAFSSMWLKPRGAGFFVSVESDEPVEDVNHLSGRRWGEKWHFTQLPVNAVVGTQFIYGIGLGELKRRSLADRTPPGEYYLRAAYTDFFFSQNPYAAGSELSPQEWYEAYHDRPILVSEPVKVSYPGEL